MSKGSFTAEISYRRDATKDLFVLGLDLGENRKDFNFKAGQYCTIGLLDAQNNVILDRERKKAWRPYSIVSAPGEYEIELFVELVPPEHGGNLTPLLYGRHIGDTVEVLPKPKGALLFESEFKNQVMVSTVTGLAPFMSMIREYFEGLKRDMLMDHSFYVLQGASYHNEFVYDAELRRLGCAWHKLARTLGNGLEFDYVPTVSRPNEPENFSWEGEKGRVNAIVEEYLEGAGLEPEDTVVYVCGHPGMIEDVKERLAPRGWSLKLKNLKEERFWK
ncbi:MAG: hypothetical protein A2754_01470 [Candidatus Magasanikbacteria bacterium RIFCSPHIGHO2_01_FULL_47_8]|uniref:FAD-binding FR-type domain-containing protein n=1 Tax=Candidatus Magasanikbacteria bacterium RIFCSPHIGHO2_01_FULL_47_8 TaxID=1798673 RepID=A0A1F6MBH5_9BACT|nr:MAG: hypothetical protein A2754_01470 [Candidatus Magasanikbacteria bacterium RIFCSPHIGHO2_01_FULL_47_8]